MSYSVERYLNRPDWLKGRQSGCGASDGTGIAGLSGFTSPYSIWMDKTEPVRDEPMDEIQRWGLLLEPVILEEFNRLSAMRARRVDEYTIYRSQERPHISCSLDAIGPNDEPVQLKTAHFAAAKVWSKEVPLAYMCQVQHEIYVMGAECGYIAVLKDGYEFAWHKVPRHQKFIDRLMKRLDHFWHNYVVKRVAPPTDYSAATTAALLRKYPTANGSVVELPDEFDSLYEEMKTLTAAESAAKTRKEEIKNRVREQLGDARYGYLPSGKGFEWSGENGSRRFTLKERCPEPTSDTGGGLARAGAQVD